jgi:hypothetical protein
MKIIQGRSGVMSYWLNRTLCDVLEEMRLCVKTLNFAAMSGLIEEAQHMGNRMEAAMEDQKDFRELSDNLSLLRKEERALKNKIKKLKMEDSAETR